MAKIRKNLGIHKVFSKYLEYIKNSRTISKYPLNAVLHISKKCCTFARRHHFSKFWDKNTQSSPPSAQANGDYTLIWLNIKFIFIVLHLPKTQEEEYKVYPLALSLCLSIHNRANALDFYSTSCKLQTMSTSLQLSCRHPNITGKIIGASLIVSVSLLV